MPINYHDIGDITNIVVSHSAINCIDPEMGGHPKKFLAFYQDTKDRPYTPSMKNGDLLHLWMEHEDQFAISELDGLGEGLAKFGDIFFDLYFKEEYKLREGVVEQVTISLDDTISINRIFESFNGQKASTEQFDLLTACIFLARKEALYDKRLKNNTVLEKFESQLMPYLRFKKNADGKIILTRAEKDTLINCHESVKAHPFYKSLFDGTYTNAGYQIYKEKEFYWDETVSTITIKRKAKVDLYLINFELKIIIIVDYKTTSYPVSLFASQDGPYRKYKLGRQLVNYGNAIKNAESTSNWQIMGVNIVVQTTDQFPTIVYSTSFRESFLQAEDLQKNLQRIAWHINENKWDLTKEEYEKSFIEI